jgi:ATP-dependent DNA helicase RecQ
VQPKSIAQLRTITGIGERKADLYGNEILAALARYREGARASAVPQTKTDPSLETLLLLTARKTFEEIATIRGRQMSTVINTVAGLVERGELEFSPAWMDGNKLAVIEAACARADVAHLQRLKPLKEVLPPEITYEEIRLVVARIRRGQGPNKSEMAS